MARDNDGTKASEGNETRAEIRGPVEALTAYEDGGGGWTCGARRYEMASADSRCRHDSRAEAREHRREVA